MTCLPTMIDDQAAVLVPAAELRALRESNAALIRALRTIERMAYNGEHGIGFVARTTIDAAAGVDLDVAGRPLTPRR